MKRIHLLVLFALVMPFMGMAAHTYRLGTYNLRIQTSKDTGEKDWDNRKGYIARTVIDNKYDVIGFQEIAGSRQKQDLEALLPNYELVAWGRNSASDSEGEGVGVAAGTFSGSVSETLITFVKLPSYCLSLTRVSLMNLPRKWT